MEKNKKPECDITCHDCYAKSEEGVVCPEFQVTTKPMDKKSFPAAKEESDDIYF